MTKVRGSDAKSGARYHDSSSLTIYEVYKISLQTEDKQTADTRVELLRQDFSIVNVDWNLAKTRNNDLEEASHSDG